MNKFITIFVLTVLLLCTALPVLGVDRVIVNSQNWQDVYSSMLYASLEDLPSNFLVSQKHGAILLYSISQEEQDLFVVSSRSEPYVYGYESFLQGRGYDGVEEIRTRNANLDLAELLTDVNKFIILDPAYGYNAISAAPYAVVDNRYVLFANSRNIDEVVNFLSDRNPSDVILFGQVDREVKAEIAQFDPEIINEGDRFSNNLEMVDRYAQLADMRQVILSNGEFIEAGLMNGADPVIFIGKANVPQSVQDYVKENDIDVGILIGNELIGTATTVRRQLGISVFVKFAQGARTPQGAVAQVEDLDRFPMPKYDLLLDITSIVYNTATGALEVTYRNPTGLALYFKGTITIDVDGRTIVLGDDEAIFLDKNEYKTIVYTTDSDDNPLQLDGEDMTAQIFTIFGEGPKALENALQATFTISTIDVADSTDIEILSLYYDVGKQAFVVEIKNNGDTDVYVSPEIIDLLINGEPVTVASEGVTKIPAGETVKIEIPVEMVEADFADNPQIKVRTYYGEREIALVKVKEKSFALEIGGGYGQYIWYVAIAVIILLLIFWLGTKKKCRQCKHKNPRGRKTCEKCGARL